MAEVNPALPQLVRHNREFICAAAARAAAAGISQFLDLGSGLPAHPAVHDAVREVTPDARVCYVDIDPVADPQVRAVIDVPADRRYLGRGASFPARRLRCRSVCPVYEPGSRGLMADRVFRAL
jgi:hypothetical protein